MNPLHPEPLGAADALDSPALSGTINAVQQHLEQLVRFDTDGAQVAVDARANMQRLLEDDELLALAERAAENGDPQLAKNIALARSTLDQQEGADDARSQLLRQAAEAWRRDLDLLGRLDV